MNNKLYKYLNLIAPFKFLLLANFFLCLTLDVMSSVVGYKLNQINVAISTIGILNAWHNVGMVLGAFIASKIIEKINHVRAFTISVIILAFISIAHCFGYSENYWTILRVTFGMVEIVALVCLESWFNIKATNKDRGFIIALYMITASLAGIITQSIMSLSDESGYVMFGLLSLFCLLASLPIHGKEAPKFEVNNEGKKLNFIQLAKRAPVGLFGSYIAGCLTGVFYALAAVYVLNIGLNDGQTVLFMTFSFTGALLFQIPMGKISDKFDRRILLSFNSLMLIVLSVHGFSLIIHSDLYLSIFAFVIGGFIFTLYPISLSFANDRVEKEEMTSASSIIYVCLGLGTVVAPVITSHIMTKISPIYFMFSVYFGGLSLFMVAMTSYLRSKVKKAKAKRLENEEVLKAVA